MRRPGFPLVLSMAFLGTPLACDSSEAAGGSEAPVDAGDGGGDGGGDGAAASGVSEEEYRQSAEMACQIAHDCGLAPDLEACVTQSLQSIDLMSGKLTFDGECAERILDFLEDADCDGIQRGPGCHGELACSPYFGAKQVGESCGLKVSDPSDADRYYLLADCAQGLDCVQRDATSSECAPMCP